MSNLENLTAKIEADSELKAKKIIEDAKKEADGLIAQSEAEAMQEKLRVVTAAQEEAKRLNDLLVSAKNIETRDKKLAAKQTTIHNVLEEAKTRLAAMDDAAFGGFVWKYLADVTLAGGETLRIPEKYAAGFDMDGLNNKLAAAGKPALTLDKALHTDNGFKLVKTDAENDFSFNALIDYYRVELEQMVVERVFR